MVTTKVREILASDDTNIEKASYLWGYYKWHAIMLISLSVIGTYLFVSWLNRPETFFNVSVVSSEIYTEEEGELNNEINDLLETKVREEAYATFNQPGQMIDRYFAQLTAGDIDIILMDDSAFENYGEPEMTQKFRIEEISEENYLLSEETKHFIGIPSNLIPLFEDYWTTQDLILMIPQNTGRRETIIKFFETQGYTLEFID